MLDSDWLGEDTRSMREIFLQGSTNHHDHCCEWRTPGLARGKERKWLGEFFISTFFPYKQLYKFSYLISGLESGLFRLLMSVFRFVDSLYIL